MFSCILSLLNKRHELPLPKVGSISDIQSVLSQVTYKRDCIDWKQTPELTWGLKRGDCEDFAYLAQALLKQIGIESRILKVWWNGQGHAVCLFDKYIFSNANLREFSNFDQIIKCIAGNSPAKWRII